MRKLTPGRSTRSMSVLVTRAGTRPSAEPATMVASATSECGRYGRKYASTRRSRGHSNATVAARKSLRALTLPRPRHIRRARGGGPALPEPPLCPGRWGRLRRIASRLGAALGASGSRTHTLGRSPCLPRRRQSRRGPNTSARPQGGEDLARAVREDGVRPAGASPGHRGLVVHGPHADDTARAVDLFDELAVDRAVVRRVDVGARAAQHADRVDRPGPLHETDGDARLELLQAPHGAVVGADGRGLVEHALRVEARDQPLLQAGVRDRDLLELDAEADATPRQLADLRQHGHALPVPGVQAAQ